jgi:hypothetical protein
MAGQQTGATATRQRFAELGASIAAGPPLVDAALQQSINQIMLDCAKEADFRLNEQYFGGNPTPQQCAEVMERDTQGNPITRAMLLGREKHQMALECVRKELDKLRPRGFSLNQRYRYDADSGRWEPLSPGLVDTLRRAGGKGLEGTLEPDVVIHTGKPLEVLDVYDFKFPCPGTNFPQWRKYPDGHPYRDLHQGDMYHRAFGVDPARVAPRWGVLRTFKKT